MSETEHHLEHAEHAQHAAADPFLRRVTMTIAIVAAILASITLLSHRAHNETLQLNIEASVQNIKEIDEWALFQAKKQRLVMYKVGNALAHTMAKDDTVNGDKKTRFTREIDSWPTLINKYEKESPDQEKKANEQHEETLKKKAESEHIHHVGDRYDLAELCVEFALVLCSVAVLTRRSGFWHVGIGFTVIGIAITLFGLFEQYGHR